MNVHAARLCQDDGKITMVEISSVLAGFVYTHPSCDRAVTAVSKSIFLFYSDQFDQWRWLCFSLVVTSVGSLMVMDNEIQMLQELASLNPGS